MQKIGTFGGKDVVIVDEEAVCECGDLTHYRLLNPDTMEWWVCCAQCLHGVMDEEERRQHAQQGMRNCLMIAVSFILFLISIYILACLGKI